jgi:hypothetical protein
LQFGYELKMTTFAVRKLIRSGLKRESDSPPDGAKLKQLKMYAIIEFAGQQFKVEKDKKLFVHRMETAEGESVEFEKVLLIDNDGECKNRNTCC